MSNPDLNPTPEAYAAMALWGDEYGPQSLGSMGWYKTLSDSRKRQARDLAQRIITAGDRHGDIFQRDI